ncbi:clathrin light chain B isoform X6 [Petaurus breviceps papuanus]|uniref:clathrin light chain B isoform X6 n=1 Tax=Petaurus breviceps papuanus TaxID=3040969 RepID=UPI0036D9C8E1
MADDFGLFSGSGAAGPAEEDPAAAFLAQQESEIAGIENDDEGFEGAEGALQQPAAENGTGIEDTGTTVNGDLFQEANGPSDGYAAVAQADRLSQEPESIRKWREEQKKRLQELDAASKVTEQEWREKAKRDLEEWNVRQNEQVEKNKVSNRIADKAFYQQPDADIIGYVYVSPLLTCPKRSLGWRTVCWVRLSMNDPLAIAG